MHLVRRTAPIVVAVLLLAGGNSHAARPDAGALQEDAPPDIGAMQVSAILDYTTFRTQQDIAAFVLAKQAEEAAAAEQARAEAAAQARVRQAPTARQAPSAAPIPSSGGACGGAGNADRFINRESGGDPTIANGGGHAANPFEAGRAWGCYQILPSTWADACGVNNHLGLPPITTYDPASQAQCASRLPASAWSSSGPTG